MLMSVLGDKVPPSVTVGSEGFSFIQRDGEVLYGGPMPGEPWTSPATSASWWNPCECLFQNLAVIHKDDVASEFYMAASNDHAKSGQLASSLHLCVGDVIEVSDLQYSPVAMLMDTLRSLKKKAPGLLFVF